VNLVDSHAHIAEESFDEDREAMLRRARAAGVELVLVIGYDLPSSQAAIRVAETGPSGPHPELPQMYATAGFAPHNVADATPEARRQVRRLLDSPQVVGVGEIGLDYHYDMPPPQQRELFGEQLSWAVEARLPVVIHSREAERDVVAALQDAGAAEGRLRGVIHCFTESLAMARAVLELGFYVSFSGILTFKTAAELRRVAAQVPLERLLIETDSPYLAPVPHRGRRNEPTFVAAVAEQVAEIHGVAADEVARISGDNCRRLFALETRGSVAPEAC